MLMDIFDKIGRFNEEEEKGTRMSVLESELAVVSLKMTRQTVATVITQYYAIILTSYEKKGCQK